LKLSVLGFILPVQLQRPCFPDGAVFPDELKIIKPRPLVAGRRAVPRRPPLDKVDIFGLIDLLRDIFEADEIESRELEPPAVFGLALEDLLQGRRGEFHALDAQEQDGQDGHNNVSHGTLRPNEVRSSPRLIILAMS
jgi:hypothetical protein